MLRKAFVGMFLGLALMIAPLGGSSAAVAHAASYSAKAQAAPMTIIVNCNELSNSINQLKQALAAAEAAGAPPSVINQINQALQRDEQIYAAYCN